METIFQPVNFKVPKSSDVNRTFEDFGVSKLSDFYINKTSLVDSFEKIQKEQGWFAKKWDSLKNFLGMKSGSSNVRNIIVKAETGQVKEETAKKTIEKYAKQQASVSQGVMNFLSSMLVIGGTMIPFHKKGRIAISLFTGVLSRVGLGIFESFTNEVNGDYTIKNGLKDAAFGAVIGGIGALGKSGSLKLEEKLSLRLLKFGIMNTIATGGSSLSIKNSLAFKLANSNLFAEMKDDGQTNVASK